MRSAYIRRESSPGCPPIAESSLLALSDRLLLKELILGEAELPQWYELGGHQQKILTLISDELQEHGAAPARTRLAISTSGYIGPTTSQERRWVSHLRLAKKASSCTKKNLKK